MNIKTIKSNHNDYQRLAAEVKIFLRQAAELGSVALVTLAREPWVSLSCQNFFPGVEVFFGFSCLLCI